MRASLLFALSLAASSTFAAACGPSGPPSKYPSRDDGCDVQVFKDAPSVQTDNIGPVSSWCTENSTDDECLRGLKDAVCKLGGDVVWGVGDGPAAHGNRRKLEGRAAHTLAPGAAPPGPK